MGFELNEKRYVKESGLETRIARIAEPVANDLGYALVRVRVTPDNGCTVQIMAEDANGSFAIADCERLSKDLSPVLDVEDPIDREYHLEVSSPGIDRPLVRVRDFAAYLGHEAKVELADMLDGRRRFRGEIVAVDADSVTIRLPDAPGGVDPDHRLPLALLSEAKLVMTDALLNRARDEQQQNPLLDDPEIETIEDTASDEAIDDDIETIETTDTEDTSEEIE